ncbi:FkbM family methyltransferase [Caulobacter sp. KR2-114]|uniref:FkbM family methyltransferase n=1 Tax=Caulobacter sp. KR2-114 TaxID=3400912 RepID=UPI003C123D1B
MTAQDFIAAAEAALVAPAANQDLARDLLSGASRRPCFVVGRNDQSADLAGRLRLEGLVDDFAEPGSTWRGLPAIATTALPADAVVINCSTSISPVAVEQRIAAAGKATLIQVRDLIAAAGGAIDQPWFVRDQRDDWRAHRPEWADVFASLEDETSRQTLLDLVRYRLTADARYMRAYSVRLQDQYFEAFLDLRAEVFVDAGGFDGDTTEQFCRRYPDYRRVHLFEPSQRNMRAARARLAAHRDIVFHEQGVSDQPGSLTFDAEAGSASAVTSGPGETVRMTTLDLAVAEPVSLIKMDLEGWELTALAGCQRHIREDRPKLAIAVYHRASDFRTVWRYARALHPDYRVYLRHYTQGWSETVMFFV